MTVILYNFSNYQLNIALKAILCSAQRYATSMATETCFSLSFKLLSFSKEPGGYNKWSCRQSTPFPIISFISIEVARTKMRFLSSSFPDAPKFLHCISIISNWSFVYINSKLAKLLRKGSNSINLACFTDRFVVIEWNTCFYCDNSYFKWSFTWTIIKSKNRAHYPKRYCLLYANWTCTWTHT